MNTFTYPLRDLNEYGLILECLERKDTPVVVSGCIDSQKAHLIAGVGEKYKNRVIITHNELKAKEIYDDLRLYDKNVCIYPAKDIMFFSADVHGSAIVAERIKTIRRMLEGEPLTVVLSLEAAMDKIMPLEVIRNKVIRFENGDEIDVDKLKSDLVFLGYERSTQVEARGQFAVRGGIIDIYGLSDEVPTRIELWDNEIDTIRSFDVESQRSIENLSEITIYPAAEFVLDGKQREAGIARINKERDEQVKALRLQMLTEEAHRLKTITEEFKENLEIYGGSFGIDSYIDFFCKDTVSFVDYFDDDTVFFLDEPLRLEEKGDMTEAEFADSMSTRLEKGYILPTQMKVLWNYKTLLAGLAKRNTCLISTLETKCSFAVPAGKYDITVKSVSSYNNDFSLLVSDIEKYKKHGYRVFIVCGSHTRAERVAADLRENEVNAFFSDDPERELQPGEIMTVYGSLHRGFEYPLIKTVYISETDIFGAEKKKRKKKTAYEGKKIAGFNDLAIGDFVVHENHGLGIYKGIEKIEVGNVIKDYIKVEYADGGNLYVPAAGLSGLQKYAAGDTAKKPKLNKLNTVEWENTKTRVKTHVEEIAKDLVELYAKRQMREGFSFTKDTVWQKEFEEMFPYEETEDQLRAIEDTKRDMESNRIMDRLICGDVGYGKTEIAIRAAFKAVSDSKQVVILVPTTILAQQHYNTFTQRMRNYPIKIDMLSRFKTASEQKKVLEKLKSGELDIVIGTHRVLSKDVEFKNLGLLVVDEEQRFGVTHKEKIKKMRENVDVLTLSATPIPRTLHMSLVGIRDMSVLEEPPVDRLPIQTYVLEYNEEIVREAIAREMVRGGQVYYVYNRVHGIEDVAARIQKLLPEANVAYAHGQMSERELEKIMYDFINGEIDVLVSTTIIETGLDISNVNTMIIEDADRLGLSQLYQLRGRVGRSSRTSYAFLMYKRDKMLKEIAEKRLQAIKEFTDLGSGFKIAMRDLEIRGAGNLLGQMQHGHMEAVGYDLYCKMLNDAVKKLKGEAVVEEDFETSVDIDIDAYIPASYIKSEAQKLEMYKRIAGIESMDELRDMQDEFVDRFGDMPQAADNLLHISLIRALAHKCYVTDVKILSNSLELNLYQKAQIDVANIPGFVALYNGKMRFVTGTKPYFVMNIANVAKKEILTFIEDVLNDFYKTLGTKTEDGN